MSARVVDGDGPVPNAVPPTLDEQVVELAVLLPDWQATALEAIAHGRGLTAGQMLRDILGEFFQRYAGPRPGNRVRCLP